MQREAPVSAAWRPRGGAAGSGHPGEWKFKGLPRLSRARVLLQVVLLGIDILSALVSRLQDRFKAQIGTGKGCAHGVNGCRAAKMHLGKRLSLCNRGKIKIINWRK